MPTLHTNNTPIFQGTEEECMDYALREYNLTDDAFTDLRDGYTMYRGNCLEILEEEEG